MFEKWLILYFRCHVAQQAVALTRAPCVQILRMPLHLCAQSYETNCMLRPSFVGQQPGAAVAAAAAAPTPPAADAPAADAASTGDAEKPKGEGEEKAAAVVAAKPASAASPGLPFQSMVKMIGLWHGRLLGVRAPSRPASFPLLPLSFLLMRPPLYPAHGTQ